MINEYIILLKSSINISLGVECTKESILASSSKSIRAIELPSMPSKLILSGSTAFQIRFSSSITKGREVFKKCLTSSRKLPQLIISILWICGSLYFDNCFNKLG